MLHLHVRNTFFVYVKPCNVVRYCGVYSFKNKKNKKKFGKFKTLFYLCNVINQ